VIQKDVLDVNYAGFDLFDNKKIGQRFPGILLTPTATSTLSPADSKTILSKGWAVVDCSWN